MRHYKPQNSRLIVAYTATIIFTDGQPVGKKDYYGYLYLC